MLTFHLRNTSRQWFARPLAVQSRTLIFPSPAKNKRRRKETRLKKRRAALLSRDWPVQERDRVFVLNPDLRVNPDILNSQDASKFLTPNGNDLSSIGEIGDILELHKLEDCVTVSGLNMQVAEIYDVYTGIKDEESRPRPIAYSRVFLIDPTDNLPTFTSYMFDEETGYKYRVSDRTGEIVPWPKSPDIIRKTYPTDTLPADVHEDTYSTDEFDLESRLLVLDEQTKERKAIRLAKNEIFYAEKNIDYQERKRIRDEAEVTERRRIIAKKKKKEFEKKARQVLKNIRREKRNAKKNKKA